MQTKFKTKTLIAVLLLSSCVIYSQSIEKPLTVRVKKTTNVNGVEKTTDSTFTVNGPANVLMLDDITDEKPDAKNGKQKKIVIVTDEIHGDNYKELDQKEIDKQIEDALKAADVDDKNYKVDKMIVINNDATGTTSKGNMSTNKIVIIKKIKIEDANSEDAKTMEKQTGSIDQKLKLDQMTFYPNPNNGKFNLNFTLADKGNTTITILNPEGKLVYNEELKDFTGTYDKEIDISSNPKGAYFVKIKQGEHAQLKKLILN